MKIDWKSFETKNNLLGWFSFIVAAIVYLSTVERKISFWDVGEYTVSAAKLGVTHAPGAALFQIFGALWAGLAMGDGSKYGLLINSMSAIFSALTIMLLFWIIVHFAKILLTSNYEDGSQKALTKNEEIITFGAGLVGAFAFMFSDTFWFSAVEGEVYAMASLFTALVIWLACKWEGEKEERKKGRWLLLICFIIGLGIGVHLMVILALPFVGYLYYAKNYKFKWESFIIANIIIVGILFFVQNVLFKVVMSMFWEFEKFFVNVIRLPFHSGSIIGMLLLGLLFFFGISLSRKVKSYWFNFAILGVFFMLIGFSCWMMIPIRANANPPMNLNSPDTAEGMLDYFNREQYGDWPVLYGANFTAYLEDYDQNQPDGYNRGIVDTKKTGNYYKKSDRLRKYVVAGDRLEQVFSPVHESFLPQMFSNDPRVMENYAQMYYFPDFELKDPQFLPFSSSDPEVVQKEYQQLNQVYAQLQQMKETGQLRLTPTGRDDDQALMDYKEILNFQPPSILDNINYLIDFQAGYMFWRYLMWNYSGRQNDFEGDKSKYKGNWISGISFIDNIRLGDQSDLPDVYKNNKAHNTYFMLPFLLGVLGFLFLLYRDFSRFWALFVTFLLTGIGIVMYTSVKPFEPRERDYAMVSAFFVFAIWIGLSVVAIYQELLKGKSFEKTGVLAVVVALLAVPALMGFQNYEDHDRSERQTAYSLAHNYLTGLGEDAILWVYGDNDTYPLWALQESEEYRSDVKVVNFTLIGSEWNIQQNLRKTYDAPPVPSMLNLSEFDRQRNAEVTVLNKEYIKFLIDNYGNDFPGLKAGQEFIDRDSMTAKEAISFLRNNKHPFKLAFFELQQIPKEYYGYTNMIPMNRISIPVNKKNAIEHGIVPKGMEDQVEDQIIVSLRKRGLDKANLFMLSMFAAYEWDRPIYYSNGGAYDPQSIFWTTNYLENQGFRWKLVPVRTEITPGYDDGLVDADKMYKYVTKDMIWGGLDDPNGYFDESSKFHIRTYRNTAKITADALLKKGQKQKALEVLDLISAKIPADRFFSDDSDFVELAVLYEKAGAMKKAQKLYDLKEKQIWDKIEFIDALDSKDKIKNADLGDGVDYEFYFYLKKRLDYFKESGQVQKIKSFCNGYRAKINKEKAATTDPDNLALRDNLLRSIDSAEQQAMMSKEEMDKIIQQMKGELPDSASSKDTTNVTDTAKP